ncbi:hypothetical protein CK203_104264 [Vitis vinifera]|uniref:Uncharacterized protein n=1 Tax=Vitis vinifera TaxID=29760 RepID=A0A438C627_VITVI|nr:hypothetical protein CK203_104264 [Vitis vinifera]
MRTFGALPEVHFLHSIYHFKYQEVKNPMLQTVRDSELKRRSYSHCKQITPKCCEISLLLREFRSLFVQCYGIPPEATRYMPQAGTLRTSRWKPISQPCEFNFVVAKILRNPLECLRNLADTIFTCENVPEASRYFCTDSFRYFSSDFVSKFPFSPSNQTLRIFSTEDERLSFLSLGVRKAGRHPLVISCELEKGSPKVKDHLEWQVLGERYEPLQSASVINFVDYSLNQGAPAGHKSAETPIGHESNGAVAGDRTSNQMVPLPLPLLGTNQMAPLPGNGATLHCACHIEYEIAEEAMNFMSYVAEVSREWGEPNARDMGRMTSQPKAKGEMYILNDGMNMKAEIAAMERRLEELEMTNMQPVQAISQTPLASYALCHLDHPNFSWKPQPPQYQQPAQAPQQASNLEQAMVNLCKVVGDFVGKQEATNARVDQRMDRVDQRMDRVDQRIDRMESTLNKRMDEMQNDLSQKLDILQDSISRLSNLNTMQEKENSPSQPYQNSMSIHEMEAEEGEPSQKKEIEEVITLRSGKEVDLPTCKLEHKVDSETEKENREEIKGKKKGKSIEKDDYDFDIDEEPQRIVIKELMKKHMPPPFLQALYGKIIQTKSQLKDANFIWDPGKLNQEQIF